MSIASEIAALPRLTVKALRLKYREVFGEETAAGNKAWLVKRIAWRMQSLADGGLCERARKRASELANDADLRTTPPKTTSTHGSVPSLPLPGTDQRLPPVGSVITRNYKGSVLQVKVLANGFEYEDQIFKSLSAVAKEITGQHCNGFLFFRLKTEARREEK